jgi:hypothetical protein
MNNLSCNRSGPVHLDGLFWSRNLQETKVKNKSRKELNMKKSIIIISLLISITASAFAGTTSKSGDMSTAQFATRLVSYFGNGDLSLNEVELADMLEFLNANVPDKTPSSNLTTRMNRGFNMGNGPTGDNGFIDLHAIDRHITKLANDILARFDENGDNELCEVELAAVFSQSDRVTRG